MFFSIKNMIKTELFLFVESKILHSNIDQITFFFSFSSWFFFFLLSSRLNHISDTNTENYLLFLSFKLMQQNRCVFGPILIFACAECEMLGPIVCQFLKNEKFSFILLQWTLNSRYTFNRHERFCFSTLISVLCAGFFPLSPPFCRARKINKSHNSSAYRYCMLVVYRTNEYWAELRLPFSLTK